MVFNDLSEYAAVDHAPPNGRISELPPDWWTEYPFDPDEPDSDSVSSHKPTRDRSDQLTAPGLVGPNCIPVPIASIPELHYIAPISNLESILKLGILSHNQARTIRHASVANPEVNQRRATRRLSSGSTVHDYANLYFNARNPMLSVLLKGKSEPLCVVRVRSRVLRLEGVIITDGNAASTLTRDFPVRDEMVLLDRSRVFLRYWPVPDNPAQEGDNKRCMMAEVLVPDIISPHFIEGIHVDSQSATVLFAELIDRSMIRVSEHLFFGRR